MVSPGISFAHKPRHNTLWLVLEYAIGQEPSEVIAGLQAIGWNSDGLPQAPPLDGVAELRIAGPRGSKLFGEWSPDERARYEQQCRETLAQYGFENVPINDLTWADLA